MEEERKYENDEYYSVPLDASKSDYKQICAAGGKTSKDEPQIIRPGESRVLEISSVRYDMNEVIKDNYFTLQIQESIYLVSSTIFCDVKNIKGRMTLRLMWRNKEDDSCLSIQDYWLNPEQDTVGMSLSSIIRSSDNEEQYIYCTIDNNTDGDISLSRYIFSITLQ